MRTEIEIGRPGGEPRRVEIELTRLGPDRFQYRVGQGPAQICAVDARTGLVHLLMERAEGSVGRQPGGVGIGETSHVVRLGARGAGVHAQVGGHDQILEVLDERQRKRHQAAGAGEAGQKVIRSPMPGKIVKVLVAEGETVAAGQGVIIVEAMKMENELRAPGPGIVKSIRVKAGETVEGNAELVVIDPPVADPTAAVPPAAPAKSE